MESGDAQGHVLIVDDDEHIRLALCDLCGSAGYGCTAFDSTEALLAAVLPSGPCVLILDVRLPGKSGLDLQVRLSDLRVDLPIIFMTGHADVNMCARAMKRGASEFLTKPFDANRVLAAIREALEHHKARLAMRREGDALLALVRSLTPRESDVVRLVVQGLLNKQIASELNIAEVTVKMHRGSAMRKLEVKSLADLVWMFSKRPDGVAHQPHPAD